MSNDNNKHSETKQDISLVDKASRFDKISRIMSEQFEIEENGCVLQSIAAIFFENPEHQDITEEQLLECVQELFSQASSTNSLIQSYIALKKGMEQLYVEQMDKLVP